MKTSNSFRGIILALACSATVAFAGPNDLVLYDGFHTDADFDNAESQNAGNGLFQSFFNGGGSVDFVPGEQISAEGASNNSLEMVTTYTGGNNFVAYLAWLGTNNAAIDATIYASLDFDIHVDPASASDANGNFGYFHMRFRGYNVFDGGTTGSDPVIGDVNLVNSMTNGWTHVSIPIDPTVPDINNVAGLLFGNDNGWITGINGTIYFYFDNLKLVYPTNPPASPVISLDTKTVVSGLHMQSPTTDAYGRGGVYTPVPDWTTQNAPAGSVATYTMTIKQTPNPAKYPYFDFSLVLAPVWATAYNGWVTEPGFDWDTSDVVWLQVLTTPSNGSEVMFSYKANLAQGAGDTFMSTPGQGLLMHYTNTVSAVGLWSLSVSNDLDGEAIFTITAPDNSQQTTTLDAADAAVFAAAMNEPRPMGGWWRVSSVPWDVLAAPYQNFNYANPSPNAGQTGVLGGASAYTVASGTTNIAFIEPFNELTLSASTNANWQICYWGADAYYTVPVSDILTWNTAWPFFALESATNLKGPYTVVPFEGAPALIGGQRQAYVPGSALPTTAKAYFLRAQSTLPTLTAP